MKSRRNFAQAVALGLLGTPMFAHAQTPRQLPWWGF